MNTFSDPRVQQTVAAIGQEFAGTPWAVQQTQDGVMLSLNVVDAQWWGFIRQTGLKEVYSYTVKFNPEDGSCSIADELRTIKWHAGADGSMQPVLDAAVKTQRGREITFKKTHVSTPFQGTVVDSTFNSESGRTKLRQVLTHYGWTEKMGKDQKIGLWFAIGAIAILLVGGGIALAMSLL